MTEDADGLWVDKDMTLSHREFYRTLPVAMAGWPYRITGDRVEVEHPEGRINILVGPESMRKIAALRLPRTHIRLQFIAVSSESVQRFLEKFDMHYRRGGG